MGWMRGVGGAEWQRGGEGQENADFTKIRDEQDSQCSVKKTKPFHRHILFGTEINLKTSEHLKGTMRNN